MEELNRLSVEDFKETNKNNFCIILDDIRSMNNVGSAFRTADAFLVEKIYISLFFKIRKPTTTAPIITYVIVSSFCNLISLETVFGKLEEIRLGVFEYGVDVDIKIVLGVEIGVVLGKVLGG